ncbi:hypothetical protein [Actinomadura rugatobispora]|uniref:Uncharacterized protein n=1 Tax=Actinomadura rugatobispora TaxID=1994 RepID=A0ABW1A067_9ACTN|nr:hypothetical protein GCM10010200_040910 [Actinomadura rugatobispora]
MTAVAPWAALDVDLVVTELRRRFPGACAWRGTYTGAWWALARDPWGRDRLIEAPDPAELARHLEAIGARTVPRFSRTPPKTGAAARSTPSRMPRPAAPIHAAPRRTRRGWLRRRLRL